MPECGSAGAGADGPGAQGASVRRCVGCQERSPLVACSVRMPAHISHLLYAEDALREATADAEAILEEAGNLFRLGAQGPDLFCHNQRTRPAPQRTAGPEAT